MTKKILLAVLLSLVGIGAMASDVFRVGDLYYSIYPLGTFAIVQSETDDEDNYKGLVDAVIPESITYNGVTYSVELISNSAFEGCKTLRSVTIPNTMKGIYFKAFKNCTGLKSVVIPESVTMITDWVFMGCTSLESVTLPNTVTLISTSAFSGCTSLKSITVPSSVTEIESSAFKGCGNVIYEGEATGAPWGATVVNGVEDGDFVYADAAKTQLVYYAGKKGSVSVPGTVTSIASNVFEGCGNVVYEGAATGSPWGAKCLNGIVVGDFVFHPKVKTTLMAYIGEDASVTIPDSVKIIFNEAFYGNDKLVSVKMPKNLERFNASSFEKCTNLRSVEMPESITMLFSRCFANCRSLKNVKIPETVEEIDDYAFFNCTSLQSIDIPESVTEVGNESFNGCSGAESITVRGTLKKVGDYAFGSCSHLSTITCYAKEPFSVNDETFKYTKVSGKVVVPCESVEDYKSAWGAKYSDFVIEGMFTSEFKVDVNDPAMGVAEIIEMPGCGKAATYKASANKGYKFLLWSNGDTHEESMTSVTYDMTMTAHFVPENVKAEIMPVCSAYYYYDEAEKTLYIYGYGRGDLGIYSNKGEWGDLPVAEVEYVEMDEGIRSIDDATFKGFTALKGVTMPSALTSMGDYVFKDCEKLTSIVIPSGVKKIGYAAFSGDTSLTDVTIAASVTTIDEFAFSQCESLKSITCKGATPASVDASSFSGANLGNAVIKVPCGSATEYAEAEGWKSTGYTVAEGFIYDFMAISDNSLMGTVTVSQMPGCDAEAIFEAKAADGCSFAGWSDGSKEAKRKEKLTDDMYVRAYFEAEKYTVAVACQNGTVEGAGQYAKGTEVTLKAVADELYHFVKWSDGEEKAERTLTVTENVMLTAVFEEDLYDVKVTAQHATVKGAGSYVYGAKVELSVEADEHYRFVKWSDGCLYNPRAIEVESSIDLSAIVLGEGDAISNQYVDESIVYAEGSTIVVVNASGPVSIYDMTGNRIAEGRATGDRQEFVMVKPGLYIVKTGKAARGVLTK